MEKNKVPIVEKDKPLWFSMWFLASVATFGVALFPMFYQFVQRRNKHFSRLNELENQVRTVSKNSTLPEKAEFLPVRNAKLWAASVILIIPIFVITYLLSVDLNIHENHEKEFFAVVLPDSDYMVQRIGTRKYVLLAVVTLGVGVIYWLYKIINAYNNHFKWERSLEVRVVELMEMK
jgi:hypothetical protein